MSLLSRFTSFLTRRSRKDVAESPPPEDAEYQPSAQGLAVERWEREMWEDLRHLEAQRKAYLEEGRPRYHKDGESS